MESIVAFLYSRGAAHNFPGCLFSLGGRMDEAPSWGLQCPSHVSPGGFFISINKMLKYNLAVGVEAAE